MAVATSIAASVALTLAKSLFEHYKKEGRLDADIPSIGDLATFVTKLVANGFGPIDANSPNVVSDLLELIKSLKSEKQLGGIADFLSKNDIASLISTCLGDIADSRPQVKKSDVEMKNDYFYYFGAPFPTVRGNVDHAKRLVKQAFQVWRRVACIRFSETTDPNACDLIVLERTIDAKSGTLAIGTVGSGKGDKQKKELVFDTSEGDWTDRGRFFLTACHETGHLLGLVHDGAIEGDLMWPTLEKSISDNVMDMLEEKKSDGTFNAFADPNLQKLATGELKIDGGDTLFSANDIKRAVAKWGPPPPPEPDADDTTPDPGTVKVI